MTYVQALVLNRPLKVTNIIFHSNVGYLINHINIYFHLIISSILYLVVSMKLRGSVPLLFFMYSVWDMI